MMKAPAQYMVNYVRVYQDKDDPKQKVGCSTRERPTRTFIEAHEEKYMQKGDVSLSFAPIDERPFRIRRLTLHVFLSTPRRAHDRSIR